MPGTPFMAQGLRKELEQIFSEEFFAKYRDPHRRPRLEIWVRHLPASAEVFAPGTFYAPTPNELADKKLRQHPLTGQEYEALRRAERQARERAVTADDPVTEQTPAEPAPPSAPEVTAAQLTEARKRKARATRVATSFVESKARADRAAVAHGEKKAEAWQKARPGRI
jgi:hypothetical protein